ncbi:MAG: hypothetical protein IKP20_06970 [Candidatus Methanomethylophilaceae archaeon]|nr:hypothetical protein [Candidatus Methanomethylophilaceae archaeon]
MTGISYCSIECHQQGAENWADAKTENGMMEIAIEGVGDGMYEVCAQSST